MMNLDLDQALALKKIGIALNQLIKVILMVVGLMFSIVKKHRYKEVDS